MDKVDISTESQKKLNSGGDKREEDSPTYNHRLSMAMDMANIKEISKLGELSGFSRSFISKVLHGHIRPTFAQAEAISRVLNISFVKIFNLSDIRDFNFQTAYELEGKEDGKI